MWSGTLAATASKWSAYSSNSLLLQAEHRLALSGTPIENNLTELYSLFRFLNPAMFGSLEDFNARYTYPIQKDNDKETMESLRRKIYPFLLRRLKRDVLKELPDRTDKRLYVEMNEEQARFYEQRRAYYYQQVKQTIAAEGVQKSQFVMFQALNELRRIASIPESLSEGRITSSNISKTICSLLFCVFIVQTFLVFDSIFIQSPHHSQRFQRKHINANTFPPYTFVMF